MKEFLKVIADISIKEVTTRSVLLDKVVSCIEMVTGGEIGIDDLNCPTVGEYNFRAYPNTDVVCSFGPRFVINVTVYDTGNDSRREIGNLTIYPNCTKDESTTWRNNCSSSFNTNEFFNELTDVVRTLIRNNYEESPVTED